MEWYDRAALEIEQDFEKGELSYEEYKQQMRDLRAEYEQARCDAAQEAYDNY